MIESIKTLLRLGSRTTRVSHLALGERGERLAVDYLTKDEGYRIVATNFLIPLGRGMRGQKLSAEIDAIAYDGEVLVFIEVKTRTTDDLAAPDRAVDLRKQRQIARAARRYRQLLKVVEEPYRYDVVTILAGDNGHEIELFRGYFDDRVFLRSKMMRE